jgi:hypothetical protein
MWSLVRLLVGLLVLLWIIEKATGIVGGVIYYFMKDLLAKGDVEIAEMLTTPEAFKAFVNSIEADREIGKKTKNTRKKKILEKFGYKEVVEILEKDVVPIDVANSQVLDKAGRINFRNPKARKIFEKYKQARKKSQDKRILEMLDKEFGETTLKPGLEKIKNDYEKIYGPLYEAARRAGRINTKRNLSPETLKTLSEIKSLKIIISAYQAKIDENKALLESVTGFNPETNTNPLLAQKYNEIRSMNEALSPLQKKFYTLFKDFFKDDGMDEADILEEWRVLEAIKKFHEDYNGYFSYLPNDDILVLVGAKYSLGKMCNHELSMADDLRYDECGYFAEKEAEILENLRNELHEKIVSQSEEYKAANTFFERHMGLEKIAKHGAGSKYEPSRTKEEVWWMVGRGGQMTVEVEDLEIVQTPFQNVLYMSDDLESFKHELNKYGEEGKIALKYGLRENLENLIRNSDTRDDNNVAYSIFSLRLDTLRQLGFNIEGYIEAEALAMRNISFLGEKSGF